MAIDINGMHPSQNPTAGDATRKQASHNEPTPQQSANGQPGTADTVSLTSAASQLSSLYQQLDAVPVVDTQRVEALREAISNGSYEIDPARVAEKFLSFENTLHGDE